MTDLPLMIEPEILEDTMSSEDILIVDLSKADTYRQVHIPGAVWLDYARIVAANKPAMGLLPDAASLQRLFSELGICPATHVVAYDDEGGGKAARLLWTLACAGHRHYSLLNGGLHAWANEGHPRDTTPVMPVPADFRALPDDGPVADSAYILERLDTPGVRLLDVRSPAEYSGSKRFADRGGHIPGAVNLEWTEAMDRQRNLRLKPDDQLLAMLASIGITPENEVIAYCQTHHRSAHTYIVLRHLGFAKVKGYPGSWSDWGNNPALPVE